jgi:hypothetical protein
MKLKTFFSLSITLLCFCGQAHGQSGQISSASLLMAADKIWMEESPVAAAVLYDQLLKTLKPEEEPFHSQIIMRAAQSRLAGGDTTGALLTLKLLNDLEYIPEHHALAASELKEMVATGIHPGHRRTPVPALQKAEHTLVVSPGGKSLTEAVTESRRLRLDGGLVEIVLAPGDYTVQEPVVLTELDNGLVIRSLDPDRPARLSGGVTLNRWSQVTDQSVLEQLPANARGKVLVSNLSAHGVETIGELELGGFSSLRAQGSDARFVTMPVPELFYDGVPQTMARWPDDSLTWLPVGVDPEIRDERYTRWAAESDLWLYGYWYWDWADAYEKVAAVSPAGQITPEPPVNRYGFKRNIGCVVNALSELDQPGEWHIDAKNNLIHYLPPEGFNPALTILSTYAGPVISATGVNNLQIRDLVIEYIRGDALEFTGCEGLLLTGLDIRYCSGLGIRITGGSEHLIHSCDIATMGRGGIDFRGGDWQKLEPSNSVIENCRISDLSRIDRTYTPALLLEGMGIKVRHCAFTDIPSSAIRLEACDALIELNYFYNCVYESGDQGAIDMWANPLLRGNVIRWNDFDRIINIRQGSYGTAAVRHDDWISGFMTVENIFRKGTPGQFGVVQFNQGTDNYVEGNIIIDWPVAFSGWSVAGEAWTKAITSHPNSVEKLDKTPWQSEAWQKKYPMVRDLLNGEDNRNFLTDNQRHGTGEWGGVRRAVLFANRDGENNFHGETLESVKPYLVPWRPIPLDRIGPY